MKVVDGLMITRTTKANKDRLRQWLKTDGKLLENIFNKGKLSIHI